MNLGLKCSISSKMFQNSVIDASRYEFIQIDSKFWTSHHA